MPKTLTQIAKLIDTSPGIKLTLKLIAQKKGLNPKQITNNPQKSAQLLSELYPGFFETMLIDLGIAGFLSSS